MSSRSPRSAITPPLPEPDARWWDAALLRDPEVRSATTADTLIFSFIGLVYATLLVLAERADMIPALEMFILTAVGLLMLALTWVDLRIRHLPNVLVAGVFLCGMVVVGLHGVIPTLAVVPSLGAGPWGGSINAVLGMLLGGGLLWGTGAMVGRFTGKPALGMGDVKLIGALGLLTGASGLPLLLLVASWSALPFAVWLMATGRRGQMIPFGPFLCLGGWVVLLFQNIFWQKLLYGGL